MKKLLAITLFTFTFSLLPGLCEAQCLDCANGRPKALDIARMKSHRISSTADTLPMAYMQQNVCGLNYTTATVLTETRTSTISCAVGTGFPTTINLTGMPLSSCAGVLQAYLYLGVSYTEATPPPATITLTNPASVVTTLPATMQGDGLPVCWAETGTATYRVDVTSQVTGSGNYEVNVSGFANANWEIDGVTLLVVYQDPTASYSGSIQINDGDICNTAGEDSANQKGFTVCSATSNATAFAMLGDMQCDVSGGVNTETFNGSTVTFPNLFWNYCAIPTSLTAGQNSVAYSTYTNDNGGDCYFLGVTGLYWQNTTCTTCVPVVTTMTLTATSTAATCGSNGTASVSVVGNAGPPIYNWSPGGQSTATATGLASGLYTVSVFDGFTCASDTVTVINSSMSTSSSSTSAYCSTLGSGTVHVTGGIAPYTYLWNPGGQTTAVATGLSAGGYTVTVSDNTGCTLTNAVIVTSVSTLSVSTSSTPVYICPATLGSVTATPSGGTPPYTYLWTPGGQTTATVTGLSAGTYSVHVSDSNGCNYYAVDSIGTIASSIIGRISTTPYYCAGNPGSATAIVSGGNPPYTYLWTPGGQTTATVSSLSAGSYSLTVTDSTGCSNTFSASVSSASVSFTVSGSPTSIVAGDSAYLAATCSIPGRYFWSPAGSLTNPNSANPVATPTVTTTYTCIDSTACGVYTDTITIFVSGCANPYNQPICIVTIDTATDRDEIIWGRTNSPASGSYNIYKENSSYTYSFLVNQPLTVLSEYIDTSSRPWLAPCSYELSTVDSCGESALSPQHTSIFLWDSTGISSNILYWTPYVGFTPTYYYIYRGSKLSTLTKLDSVSNTTFTYTDLAAPPNCVYMIEVLNPSGPCVPTTKIRPHGTEETAISMSNPRRVKNPALGIPSIGNSVTNLTIYPNPANGEFTLQWSVVSGQSSVLISIIDELGQVVYSEERQQVSGTNKEQINLENLASGIYSLRLQTSNSSMVKKLVVMGR